MTEYIFDLQLFGGGGGGSAHVVKASAPGSTQAATIENATAGARQETRDKLAKAYNRASTNKTATVKQGVLTAGNADSIASQVKKALLGE